jgi:hypothetical protein
MDVQNETKQASESNDNVNIAVEQIKIRVRVRIKKKLVLGVIITNKKNYHLRTPHSLPLLYVLYVTVKTKTSLLADKLRIKDRKL